MGVGLVAASHFAVIRFITAKNAATDILLGLSLEIDVFRKQHCDVSPCVDVRVFLSVA